MVSFIQLLPGSLEIELVAHQPRAATFRESTGQPGQSKLRTAVPAVVRPPYRTTRTYVVWPADIVRYSWARSNMSRDQ
jgi:hypothetical protein